MPAFIFCRLNTWMRFSLRVMDTLGWSILARAAIRQTAPIRAIPFGRARLLARVSKTKLSLSCVRGSCALWEIGSRYYSSADAVNDGSAAFEVSLSSAGVTTNGEYYIPRLCSGDKRSI